MSYHGSSKTSTTSTTTTTAQRATSYQGQTAPAGYHYMPNGTLMLDSQMDTNNPLFEKEATFDLITGFDMNMSSVIEAGESRSFVVTGSSGATFELEIISNLNEYYNFNTKLFQTAKSVLKEKIVGTRGFRSLVKFPLVTGNKQYDILITATGDTTHAKYSEARFNDDSVDINFSTGSSSLLMRKVIYQYVDLDLIINPYWFNGASPWSALTNVTIAVSSGVGLAEAVAFSTNITVANNKALRIIKQPTHQDILSFVAPTIAAAPIAIPGENIYPAITTAANSTADGGTTVNGSSTGTTVTTHVVSSTIATIGDRVLGNAALAAKTVTVTAISGGSGKTFTISEAISIADDLPLTFSNQMNYRWPINNNAHVIQSGFSFLPVSYIVADSVIANYLDTTTALAGTINEKTFINREYEAVDTLGLKPTITNGKVTTQAGAIVFDKQQPLALASSLVKTGGYGQKNILRALGYDLSFSNLAIALTPVTTTTTAAVNGSTSVPVASRNGILDDVSTVSGIGITAGVVDPTVDTGAGAVSGAGTLVLTAAQTLEDDTVLTFANAGLVATITGDVQVLKAGTASVVLNFDIDKLLSIT